MPGASPSKGFNSPLPCDRDLIRTNVGYSGKEVHELSCDNHPGIGLNF